MSSLVLIYKGIRKASSTYLGVRRVSLVELITTKVKVVVTCVVLLTIVGGSNCVSYNCVRKEVLKGVRVVLSSNNKRSRKLRYKGVLSRVLLSAVIREIYVEDIGPY